MLAELSTVAGMSGDSDPELVPHTPEASSGSPKELADRLQEYLANRGVTDLERAAMVGGQVVDLLFTVDGENTAVLIDAGWPPERDPARHLRLTHARADVLLGPPPEAAAPSPPS